MQQCVAAAAAVAGIELIAEGLAGNSSLLCLDLSGNKIGNAGALALAEALHSNKTLAELQLSNNRIGAIGTGVLQLWYQKQQALHTMHAIAYCSMHTSGRCSPPVQMCSQWNANLLQSALAAWCLPRR